MARRHKYHGITSISLGEMPVKLDDQVKVQDVLLGVAAGLLASAGVKAVLNKFAPDVYAKIKDTAGPAIPLLTGISAAAVLYYAQKGSSMAKGHAVGAVAAGLAATLMSYLPSRKIPYLDFSDVVSLNLSGVGGYSGLLVNDHSDQFNGLLVNDKSDSLNQLAAYSMGEEDEDGLMALSAM